MALTQGRGVTTNHYSTSLKENLKGEENKQPPPNIMFVYRIFVLQVTQTSISKKRKKSTNSLGPGGWKENKVDTTEPSRFNALKKKLR